MQLAWINEKGGTLKTTLAVHSAVYLAVFRKEPTVLLDLDPQGQSGKTLGLQRRLDAPGIRELLLGEVKLADAVTASGRPELDLVCAEKSLADVPEILAGRNDAYQRLKIALHRQRKYRNVVIDSPPSLGILTRNILAAASDVIIPVSLSFLSLDGAAEIVQTIEATREELGNPQLKVTHVVPTLYRRTRLADAVLGKLQEHFGKRCLKTRIGISVKVDEAQSWGKTIWEYAPRSSAAATMTEVMSELFGRPRADGIAALRRLGKS